MIEQREAGFSLVELAVVIVIAGILAAVAVPLLSGLTEDSKWAEGNAILGSVERALQVHIAENNGIALSATPGEDFTGWGDELGIAPSELDQTNYFTGEDLTLEWQTDAGDNTSAVNYRVILNGGGDPDGVMVLIRKASGGEKRLDVYDSLSEAPSIN